MYFPKNDPFSVLARAVTENLRVRVHVRGQACVRSHLVGFLVAFDKHWNLALKDIEETYFRHKTKGVFRKNLGSVTLIRTFRNFMKLNLQGHIDHIKDISYLDVRDGSASVGNLGR